MKDKNHGKTVMVDEGGKAKEIRHERQEKNDVAQSPVKGTVAARHCPELNAVSGRRICPPILLSAASIHASAQSSLLFQLLLGLKIMSQLSASRNWMRFVFWRAIFAARQSRWSIPLP